MYALMIAMNICSDGTPPSAEKCLELAKRYRPDDGPMGRFLYHRALWRHSGFDTYQYTLSRRCFAMPESDVRVRVEAGRVVSAFTLPEEGRREAPLDEALNMDEYFEQIRHALAADPTSVAVEYHPVHGYPLSISIGLGASVSEPGYQTA